MALGRPMKAGIVSAQKPAQVEGLNRQRVSAGNVQERLTFRGD